jgi:hypothetical protein
MASYDHCSYHYNWDGFVSEFNLQGYPKEKYENCRKSPGMKEINCPSHPFYTLGNKKSTIHSGAINISLAAPVGWIRP